MALDQYAMRDPLQQYPGPPFDKQKQPGTGESARMNPEPDYGETTYRGSARLAGRRALVTGGDSGIGRAVALAFAREGADVCFAFLESDEDAAETTRLIESAGRRAIAVRGDLRDEATCVALVDRAIAELGGLDILVNNAAYQMERTGIAAITTEQFDRVMKTNVYAPFWLCRRALPLMPAGATIVNTASVEATTPSPTLLDYASTKGAIVTFTQALAHEAIERGIRVNCVAPGPVWTPLIPATMSPEEIGSLGTQSPTKRPAQPAEIAPAFVFLASQESSYVTGARIAVTGGMLVP